MQSTVELHSRTQRFDTPSENVYTGLDLGPLAGIESARPALGSPNVSMFINFR